jgi:hypothetical protein
MKADWTLAISRPTMEKRVKSMLELSQPKLDSAARFRLYVKKGKFYFYSFKCPMLFVILFPIF